MDVGFQDITYTVRKWYHFGVAEPGSEILHGLSGCFRSGRLTAILGPSGAGKSSLLNALSGCSRSGVSGQLLVGGAARDEAVFRRQSCYLMQEDLLQPLLTVRELMLLAAELKMPAGCPLHQRNDTVHDILKTLGLWEARDTRSEALSGGQRKRLCVALELVNNPPVFFLDEPTSGLDEVSAKLCLRLLHELSRQGRAVICTLHTPSASLLALLDDVYAIARGHCVYNGPADGIVSFLADAGLHCPRHYNPADYLLEVTDNEDPIVVDILSSAVDNGRYRWEDPTPSCDADSNATAGAITTASPETCGVGNGSCDASSDSGSSENYHQQAATSSYEKLRSHSRDRQVSCWRQFCVLSRRMLTQFFRNKVGIALQLFHHLICSVFTGLILYGRANDGTLMFDHLKFCVAIILFHSYTWCMVQVILFPVEVKLLTKEHLNRWYSLCPYYMASQLIRLPSMIFLSMIFLSITYTMAGLPLEINRFLLYSVVGIITSVAAEGLGYAIGSTFTITNGCAVAPAAIAPFIGLAVYGFDFAHQIPSWMNVLMYLSFIRSGVVSLVLIVFGLRRPTLDCSEIYCHYADPEVILRMTALDDVSLWLPISCIILLLFIFRTLAYIGLRVRLAT